MEAIVCLPATLFCVIHHVLEGSRGAKRAAATPKIRHNNALRLPHVGGLLCGCSYLECL